VHELLVPNPAAWHQLHELLVPNSAAWHQLHELLVPNPAAWHQLHELLVPNPAAWHQMICGAGVWNSQSGAKNTGCRPYLQNMLSPASWVAATFWEPSHS
jgi:hypothetical protein